MTREVSGCMCCGKPCDSSTYCSVRNITEYYCDICGDETSGTNLYKYEDMELCKHCLLEQFETVV